MLELFLERLKIFIQYNIIEMYIVKKIVFHRINNSLFGIMCPLSKEAINMYCEWQANISYSDV